MEGLWRKLGHVWLALCKFMWMGMCVYIYILQQFCFGTRPLIILAINWLVKASHRRMGEGGGGQRPGPPCNVCLRRGRTLSSLHICMCVHSAILVVTWRIQLHHFNIYCITRSSELQEPLAISICYTYKWHAYFDFSVLLSLDFRVVMKNTNFVL